MLYFAIQNRLQDRTGKVSEAAGARWRFYVRIWSDYPRIVFLLAEALQGVSAEILSFKISWQAQYLVRLTWSTHWKWRFICDADHSWHSFCVASAVFGEVGGWLDLVHALEMTFHMWRRSLMTFILRGRRSTSKHFDRTGKVSEAAGARWRFYVRIWSDYPRIVFLLAEALQGVSAEILSFKISWQAQYLVRLVGDLTWSTHWKWRFICDADHGCHSFCVAGAVFGEVGGWLDLVHALEMTFHMWCRSLLTFILRGRRSIWWGWRVILLAPRIGNEVSYVTQIIDDIHFAWQAQYLVRLDGDCTCSAHWKWRFICDADHCWHSFCVAGAVFGEVAGWLDLVHTLEMTFYMWRRSWLPFILRGRRSIWWGWRVTWLGPRIGNDVSYVTQIIADVHFAWQAQYLVRLEGDLTWSIHWQWGFICDADYWWHLFCVDGDWFSPRFVVQSSTGIIFSSTGVVLYRTE